MTYSVGTFFPSNPATSISKSTTQMTVNSREAGVHDGWDVPQLLSVVNRPRGPDLTVGALMDFTSSKEYPEIARRLKEEEAAKLADIFDQVCDVGLRNTLARLTTAAMTRPSHPSIEEKLKIRCH